MVDDTAAAQEHPFATAGASLRAIADAAGLSHTRIDQILKGE